MDMIITIFKSLGVDQTVFIQFVILIVIFAVVSNVLFERVKTVLEYREGKTTKLESTAHAVYKQADDLAEQYKARVEKTHQDSHHEAQKKKMEIAHREREIIKNAEDNINKEYEEKRSALLSEMSAIKNKNLKEVDQLSSSLVDKLIK